MCKTHRTQKFRAQRLSWYSFGDICRPFQPSHLKNHEFQFFTKLPTKPSSYAVVHRQPWPCAKIHRSQNFRAPRLSWYSFVAFGNLFNHHISKITNFNFSQNSPPSHLAMPWCTDQRGHVQNPPNSKLSWPTLSWYSFGGIWRPFQPPHLKNHEFHFFTKLPTKSSSYSVVHRQPCPCAKPTELKTFVHQDFQGMHLGTFGGLSNHHFSKITNFIFSQNSPPSHIYLCRGAPTNLAMCKTHRTQNIRAPRLPWYSFGGIWRPIQPSHLKNHEVHFFTKLPTKPSIYAVVHRQPWPCRKPTELKTFVHQDFHGIHLGTFGGQSNHHISKTTNLNFSQHYPPSHLAMPWCTDQLGHVQNTPNSKLSCTKTFMVFIWAHLEANPSITSQKPRISFFPKTPHQAI